MPAHNIFYFCFLTLPAMIFVQTNNYSEHLLLEEQFSRDDNLFAVPVSRSSKVKEIISSIKSEILGVGPASTLVGTQDNVELWQMCSKMDAWLQNSFRLHFSLSTLREIYQLIKLQATKIAQYQAFYFQLTEFMQDEQGDMQDHHNQLVSQKSITPHQTNLPIDYNQQKSTQKKIQQCSSIFIQENNAADNQLMHSLRSQLPFSPKFTMSGYAESKKAEQTLNNLCEEENLTNVQDSVCKLKYSEKNKRQLKKLKSLVSTEQSESKADTYAILSGRVNPIPSFLHYEDSFGEMVVKQKKQDIRKSKIINSEIRNSEYFKEESEKSRNYNSSIRAIQFNNKLRKNSRKSISSKFQLLDDPAIKTGVDLQNQKTDISRKSSFNTSEFSKTSSASSKKNCKFFRSQI